MRDVLSVGSALVAVGGNQAPNGLSNGAAVWTSRNGLTWARAPYDQAVFGSETLIESVASSAAGLVAVGSDGSWGGHADAVVLVSPTPA